MIIPKYNQPGSIIPNLSLDAAKPLYPMMEIASDSAMINLANQIFKSTIQQANFTNFEEKLYRQFMKCARETLSEAHATAFITWLWKAFTGDHRTNPDMVWSDVIIEFFYRDVWPEVGQAPAELKQIKDFCAFYLDLHDNNEFERKINEIEESFELTDWDREIHQRYNYVYFDDRGNDPFLSLEFVYEGQCLRDAIRRYDFPNKPDFPLEKFRRMAQMWVVKNKVWFPPGVEISKLTDVE